MKSAINEIARKAGFFASGVASAKEIDELCNLTRWIERGFAADMHWLKRNPFVRCNPSSLLNGATSIICLAAKYRFRKGLDYHDDMHRRLRTAWEKIKKSAPHARAKFCVDTSPILEKPLAVRAGIGWQGKHSIVVHPSAGSFFVLGEIITDIEIEKDKPTADMCGDCTLCIEACPTGAIVEPYVVDAGRCLSYWTIEHKGPISKEFERYIKKDQYGCELCQEACPYNKI